MAPRKQRPAHKSPSAGTVAETPAGKIPPLRDRLRKIFYSGQTRPLAWRRAQLQALLGMLEENEEAIQQALAERMAKPPFEAWLSETAMVAAHLRHTLAHLRRWMRPRRTGLPLLLWPGRGRVLPEPKGVVLILGPWNYPLQMTLGPLVDALAAGNCVVLKPSEKAPEVSRLLARLIPRYLDPAVAVVEGGASTAQALLEHPWDHVFYTGGEAVARLVYAAAAQHLTPVTLELGGKNPALVLADAPLAITAQRIAWGRFLNAGQVCLSPDYVLVEQRVEQALLAELKTAVERLFGPDPAKSSDYGRMVDDGHFRRVAALMSGGRPVTGGQTDPKTRYIAPTVLTRVNLKSPLMREEVFGPLLPVIPVKGLDQALEFVRERPKPLALYLFTRSRHARRRAALETSSGALVLNDTVVHIAGGELPFGGVGASGLGAYHGRAGFLEFSHQKPVLLRLFHPNLNFHHPPFRPWKEWILRRVFRRS
ncbi:MAG: aldehyde dehydrogenase family protein [Deltaproteobacteria bacterium]|nr:aldehyde dehydrogenase family protein [Deltaproteobacteria bacterium]